MIRPPTPPKQSVIINPLNQNQTQNQNQNQNQSIDKQTLTREQRLEQIKTKLKRIQQQEINTKLDELPNFDDTNKPTMPSIQELIQSHEQKIEKDTPKQFSKKTIKRRFTLGKSDKLRQVAILLTDKQTRKNIINAQKDLKKTNITDVKKYLRQHGIIKVGSTCPNDILRKTFESAMLAGDVTNTNKDTLLHNLLHDTNNIN
jgi:hypothetical protein